jgi:hypothetical protein
VKATLPGYAGLPFPSNTQFIPISKTDTGWIMKANCRKSCQLPVLIVLHSPPGEIRRYSVSPLIGILIQSNLFLLFVQLHHCLVYYVHYEGGHALDDTPCQYVNKTWPCADDSGYGQSSCVREDIQVLGECGVLGNGNIATAND